MIDSASQKMIRANLDDFAAGVNLYICCFVPDHSHVKIGRAINVCYHDCNFGITQ